MSLDDVARTVWQTKDAPLAVLVAGKVSEMLSGDLPTMREPVRNLTAAIEAWWPQRGRDPADIYEKEFTPCLEASSTEKPQKDARATMTAANVQMAALVRIVPRDLPAGEFYDMGEEDFVKLLRDAAKASKLPVAQLEARLKVLLEHQKEPWRKIVAAANRMTWARGESWGKLDKRLRQLVSLADLGATSSWSEIGGRQALRLELDGVKRIAPLTEEEIATLRRLVPAIPEP